MPTVAASRSSARQIILQSLSQSLKQSVDQLSQWISPPSLDFVVHEDRVGLVLGPESKFSRRGGKFAVDEVLFRFQGNGCDLRIVNGPVAAGVFQLHSVGMEREPGPHAPR